MESIHSRKKKLIVFILDLRTTLSTYIPNEKPIVIVEDSDGSDGNKYQNTSPISLLFRSFTVKIG